MNYQKASEVTEMMIQDWQDKFKTKVRIIEVPIVVDEVPTGEKAKFFIRKPDRTLLDQLSKHYADREYGKANSVTVKNCVLGGDMNYLAPESEGGNDDIFSAVLNAVAELVEKKKATFLN